MTGISRKTSEDVGSSDIRNQVLALGVEARKAARKLARSTTKARNDALLSAAAALEAASDEILEANRADIADAIDGGLAPALLDRLELNHSRVSAMADGVRQIAALGDPVGEMTELVRRPSGIEVGRMRVPLGVIGIIYESRPNVTADAAALCIKSGNAAILRGGSEASRSNHAIAACLHQGLDSAGLPVAAASVIATTDRAAVGEMLSMDDVIDVIIPRGGKGLIERVSRDTRIPVIKHLDGLCHVYIDDEADVDMAVDVAFNAKTRRYGICGAMETLLVARPIAARVIPRLFQQYRDKGVELRGCQQTRMLDSDVMPASEEDWSTEYLAPILSVRIVDGIGEAIEHITRYGSGHTDAIVTGSLGKSRQFITEVDSSSVMVNASTQFADGFEYGLGAEIGISTNKLHVRGPVGLEGLTTLKYVVQGDGAVRP